MRTHEPEVTSPVDLCLANGKLNPDAVGWTRTPLHRANLRGWGRVKRWEYWAIVTPTHIIDLVVSSLDYAGWYAVYVLDRGSGAEVVNAEATLPFAWNMLQPERSGIGTAAARGRGIVVDIDQHHVGSSILASTANMELDVYVPLPRGHESLGVVIPWSDKRFQLTVKDVGRPVRGQLRLDGQEIAINEDDAFAVLDHGRGKWPYHVTWNWAAGSGPGNRSIQLGGQWTDGTGLTENGLCLDGRLHKIGEELRWEYDRDDWMQPWRISGERVEATVHPFHQKVSRHNWGVVANRTDQCFGDFSGWASADDGTTVSLDGLVGWAEEARHRW